jgi:hypothetical protein
MADPDPAENSAGPIPVVGIGRIGRIGRSRPSPAIP